MPTKNTLPFEGSADRNKRKWQCFCCGKFQEDYAGYKIHIEDEHELGRDYVSCPQCKAPVRDLKLHWNVKHARFPLPQGVQFRAIIWKDFSGRGGGKTRKPSFKTGEFASKKNQKAVPYKSGYECQVYQLLEQMPEVVHYDAEPFRIPYHFEGESRIYLPDLAVLYLDGHKEIVEIKPATQQHLPINLAKWAVATKFCEARGWKFKVMTEADIAALGAQVKRSQRRGSGGKDKAPSPAR